MVWRERRRGISRVEVLVVLFILFVGGALFWSAIPRAHESSKRLDCVNNLRQLGLACWSYADAHPEAAPQRENGYFMPTEATGESVFITLLPYVEQQALYDSIKSGGEVQDVKLYACPSRARLNGKGLGDYGYGSGAGQVGVTILAAPRALMLTQIDDADGLSSTLLLSHKGVNTNQYDGSGPNDTGWHTLDHARSPGDLFRDCKSSERDLSGSISSPHVNVCPSLYADAHVANISYTCTIMPQLWAYNDGSKVSPP
ncbi:MAG: DUF1559 domain-containing protein [Gemmataceae bacterium]|nr:DUF1559 domain-containing protein [Gemmataceae bacterium]